MCCLLRSGLLAGHQDARAAIRKIADTSHEGAQNVLKKLADQDASAGATHKKKAKKMKKTKKATKRKKKKAKQSSGPGAGAKDEL